VCYIDAASSSVVERRREIEMADIEPYFHGCCVVPDLEAAMEELTADEGAQERFMTTGTRSWGAN
jgi:hypothetical protein